MKTQEELNALKEEAETVSKKSCELTEEELTQVSGGARLILREDPESTAVVAESEVKLRERAVAEHLKIAEELYESSKKSTVIIEGLLR